MDTEQAIAFRKVIRIYLETEMRKAKTKKMRKVYLKAIKNLMENGYDKRAI